MSQLQDNLNEILRQKNDYLLPANLRAGVTLLGVEGNMQADKPDQTKNVTPTTSAQQVVADTGYELAAVNVAAVTSVIDANITSGNIKNGVSILGVTGNFTGTSKCKVFNSVTDMNSSVGNADGDIAIIYGINPVTPNTTGFNANVLILAETCPADVVIPNNALSVVNGTYSLYLHPKGDSPTNVYLDSDFGDGGESYILWSRASGSTGDYTTRYTHFGNIVRLNDIGSDYGPQTITSLKISDPSASIWDYIKFGNISTMEVYIYNGKTSTWNIAKSELNTDASKVISGTTVLGGNGLLTGTLNLNTTKKLQTIPVYTSASFSNTQSDLSISVPNSYAMIDITTVPQGLGDKRWVLAYCMIDMMMGSPDYFYQLIVLPDDKNVLYHTKYDDYNRLLGNVPSQTEDYDTYMNAYDLSGGTIRKTPTVKQLTELTPFTSIGSTSSGNQNGWATYSGAGGLTTLIWMATNAEIRDVAGNVLRPAGPQASDYYTNQSYTNIFGETVVGTKVLPTMTNAEIDTAVDTTENILGEPEIPETPDPADAGGEG